MRIAPKYMNDCFHIRKTKYVKAPSRRLFQVILGIEFL